MSFPDPVVPSLDLRAEGACFEIVRSEVPRLPPPALRVLDHRPAACKLTLQCDADSPPSPRSVHAALADFVRSEAARVIPAVLAKLADGHGFPRPPRVRIALQKTVWASRSGTGTVSASLLLMFLPEALMRHVLLHELCHIRHMNHGPEFHALLAQVDEKAAVHAAALKTAVSNYIPEWIRDWR